MTYRKKLIEVALPLAELNDASAYDKMPGIGPHPKGIHQWWARLPLPTARAVLFASLVDDPSSDPAFAGKSEAQQGKERERLFDIIRALLGKKPHLRPEVFRAAQAEIVRCCGVDIPPVLDPFCGGGSIPLEAQRLGLKAYASDLNPVAVLITKALIEIPPKFAGKPPVNPTSRGERITTTWRGAQGLAEDIRYYGGWIRDEAEKRIGSLYPKVKVTVEMAKGRPDLKQYINQELTVIAWLWTRTVQCPNPGCKARTPLVRSFWLSTKEGKSWYADPVLDVDARRVVGFAIRDRGKPVPHTTDRNGARCLFCPQPMSKPALRKTAVEHGLGVLSLAVVADGRRGRVYLPGDSMPCPTKHKPDVPFLNQPMTNDRRWFSPPLYGLPNFADIFTPRQLVALTTFSDLVAEAREKVLADATTTKSLPVDGRPLAEGGTGTRAYADAVATYLAFAVDRQTDFNCGLSTWKPSGEQQMHLFGKQAIPMVWDYAEANVFSDKAICWVTSVELTAAALDTVQVGGGPPGQVAQQDAASASVAGQGILVSSDPPYYDNIGYAELSDFFYVWLRRTLAGMYPDLFRTMLAPKEAQLVATPSQANGDAEKAKGRFEAGFREAFKLMKANLDPRFPMTVYYAYKQSEEDEDEEGAQSSSGWETMLESLLAAGFEITATWPVRASQKWRMVGMGTNALASYIVIACRARPDDAPLATRKEFGSRLKKDLPDALAKLQQGNVAPVDFAQAAIGPGMAVFSRYSKVVEADGGPMSVRTALQIINQELDAYLAEQEGELDRDTRFCVAWFGQHGMEEDEFGQADVLARAMNTAVNGLAEVGVLRAKAGKVKLLGRDELPEDWDPASDKRLTVWERTQQLIRALEKDGEKAAAVLVAKLGAGKSEEARALAYRLYSICERKKWAKEALAYNSLVIAWPEILKQAASLPGVQTDAFGKE